MLVEDRREPGARLSFALTAGRPGAMVQRGRMGHHGGWLEWFGSGVAALVAPGGVAEHVARRA